MESIKKTFWTDAAKAGGVVGLVIFIFYVLSWMLRLEINAPWAKGTFEFMAIAISVYHFGRKRSLLYGNDGFTYGQSIGFILAMMLFAGAIVGFGQFILQQHIAPGYFQEVMDVAMVQQGVDIDSESMKQTMTLIEGAMKNPIIMVISGMMGMVLYGLFIGILASIFIKRQPNIFPDSNEQ